MNTENAVLQPVETSENNDLNAKLPPIREENTSAKSENSSQKTNENYVLRGGKAYVGHSLALKLTGSSAATLHRYATGGKLSFEKDENGHKIYQVVELERVFGTLKSLETNDNISNEEERKEPETLEPDVETLLKIAALEGKNAVLEAQLQAEREKTALLEKNADDLRQSLKMLTYRPEAAEAAAPVPTPQPEPQPQPVPQPKRGFFGRLLGGGNG